MVDEETESQDARGFEPTTSEAGNLTGSPVGPVARGLSTALMQGAFESFGRAFTQTGDVARDTANEGSRMAPWRQQGAKTAGALEMRWHTMEYENFQAQVVEPYMTAKKQMMQQYMQLHADLDSGIKMGPDGVPQNVDISSPGGREEMIRLRGQLEKDFYGRNADMDVDLFHYAAKYPSNPLVSERIKRISESTSNQLMKATNPDQTLQAEGKQSEITARMMGADTANIQAKAAVKNASAKALKEPTSLRQVRNHPEMGPQAGMEWLVGSVAGEAFMFGHRGGDAYRDATNHYEQALIKQDPKLETQPEKLQARLHGLQGRIRKLAAHNILKELDPPMLKASREATPWLFDFEKAGVKVDGIIPEDGERGWKGDRRISTQRKKDLFEGWKLQWEAELDEWASRPEHELSKEAAMDHMTAWIKDAISNGAPGVPNDITIAINESTKDVREELIEALIQAGGRDLLKNHYMAEAHPIGNLLEKAVAPFTSDKRHSGRRRRGITPRSSKGILGE